MRIQYRLGGMFFYVAFSFFLLCGMSKLAKAGEATAVIHGDQDGGKISRHIYGHFAEHLGRCIYDGIWVGEDSEIPNTGGVRNDIIEALKAIQIPNLRWPGGCYADDYHWRDGIGPQSDRPKRINIHWGGVKETNAFGTHEFLDLCELLGAEPYVAGNLGSGTPQEMRDWIEYMTYDGDSELANLRRANGREKPWKVKYFGVGNENWGCGGSMTPEYYADVYKRFAVFCRNFSGNRLVRIGCGANGHDRNWSKVVMSRAGRQMQGLSLHYYTLDAPWNSKQSAIGFQENNWIGILGDALRMEDAIQIASEEMERVDPRKRVKLYVDEWGTWYQCEPGHPGWGLYQQNSIRDALVAGLTFHIFHQHNERVHMANIAQTVNVLQAMILTQGEKMLLTPTYHVFEMYKVHHDATHLPIDLKTSDYALGERSIPAISMSASRDSAGKVHLSIVNTHASEAMKLECSLNGIETTSVSGRILTGDKLDSHNTFDQPEQVNPENFEGAKIESGKLQVQVPARSVVVLEL